MNLRERRMKRKMTVRDLAEKSGVSICAISEIETGKRRTTERSAKKLAKAFGLKNWWILCEDFSAPPSSAALPKKQTRRRRAVAAEGGRS